MLVVCGNSLQGSPLGLEMKTCHLVSVSAALAVLLFAASAEAFIGRPLPRNRAGELGEYAGELRPLSVRVVLSGTTNKATRRDSRS